MNNNAQDIIGSLRAVNILLLLLHVERFTFPLDVDLSTILQRYHPRFVDMLDLVSELAQFDDARPELFSAIDDILHRQRSDFYTREYVELLLSVYNHPLEHKRVEFDHVATARVQLANLCVTKVSELVRSILWVRVAFRSFYPAQELPALSELWLSFCRQVSEVAAGRLAIHPRVLAVDSLRNWQQSDAVRDAVERVASERSPDDCFAISYAEVDNAIDAIESTK